MRRWPLLLALLALAVAARAQTINSLSPNFSPPTVSPYTLTVSGSGFTSGAVVLWQGVPLQTTFINAAQLTAIVPCCYSYGVSTVYITVLLTSGNTSLPVAFLNFGPAAPITSYSPTRFIAGVGASLQVHGNYFISGCQIYFDNILQATTFVSQTLVTANVPGGSVDSRHFHSVRVRYPVVGSSVRLTPASLSFGSVAVGASSMLPVSVANLSSSSLTVSSITLSGSTAFTQTNNCSGPLAPYSGCSFNVTFSPVAVGNFSGQITIVDSGVGSPHVISLAGTGGAPFGPIASFSPNSLNFPNTAVGSSSTSQVITLTNIGGSSLTISAVALGGAGSTSYGLSDACVAASPLAASASCNDTITFTPLSTGTLNATLNYTDTAPGSPQQIPLSGTGTSAHYAVITWTASVSPGVTGYNTYRGTVSGGPYSQINGSLIGASPYTDFTAVSGQHYCYVVTAVAPTDTPAESVYSAESCTTIP